VPRGNGAAPICSPHRQQARAAFEVRTGFGGRALVGAASMLARASCTPAVPLTLEMVHQDGTSYRVALRSNYVRYPSCGFTTVQCGNGVGALSPVISPFASKLHVPRTPS
jgi:hypothetical protein